MKNLIQAAAVTLFAASTAQAQQAVQWRVQDGGNGHWYFCTPCTTGLDAQSKAEALRAHLVTVTTAGENAFVRQLLAASGRSFAMLGLVQLDNQPAPQLGWAWTTGEPVVFENWTNFDGAYRFSAPDDRPCSGDTPQEDNQCNQGLMYLDGRWDDVERGPSCAGFATSSVAVVEWSADCNGDGIVDYGQCRDGSLPDYNGNSIPDCCESGTPCEVGNYPVQWRVADYGNGHWFGQFTYPYGNQTCGMWECAAGECWRRNGHLATAANVHELAFIGAVGPGAAIGGVAPVAIEPDGSCVMAPPVWVTGEAWPAELGTGQLHCPAGARAFVSEAGVSWVNAIFATAPSCVCEWSADCDGDGSVDYGQILQGQRPDTNSNGVPDGCECASVPALPACCAGDLNRDSFVDGADLGILLNAWGTCPYPCVADIDRDGLVDGTDLGPLLGSWGPCKN